MFLLKNRPGHGEQKNNGYCKLHNQRIIRMGNCLTCTTTAAICETKGCIKHHVQNQRIHSFFTIEYLRHVVKDYTSSDQDKKAYLKKMISDYFMAAKKALEVLYDEIYESVEHFKFDNVIFNAEEQGIIKKLIEEDYNNITCSEIGIVIPKLLKYTHFQQGHFGHLREYLKNQKQKIVTLFDSIVLNLPYFRENIKKTKAREMIEISSQWLRQVNQKLKKVEIRPKKLCIKYIDDEGEQDEKVLSFLFQRQFIRNLCTNQKISSIEQLELYCVWNIHEEDFQIAFFEALLRYPFLRTVNIYTGYKVTNTEFVDQIVSDMTMDVRIYKKQWKF